ARENYEVISVGNGLDAWQALESMDTPHLVIVDWMMPGLDGIELTRKLRESGRSDYAYVIMLTAKSDKEHVVAGMNAGADDFLSKPFHAEELRARLRAGTRILKLQERLRVEARHDALTGVLNRGTIIDVLER